MTLSSKFKMPLELTKLPFDLACCSFIKIKSSSIQKFVDLADEEYKSAKEEYKNQLAQVNFDRRLLYHAADASNVCFDIYCLAIVHCYAEVEKNRTKLISMFHERYKLSGKTKKQTPDEITEFENELFKIEEVNKILKKYGIVATAIKDYSLMEEFRKVNNAVKHRKIANVETVLLVGNGRKTKKEYKLECIQSLYKKHDGLNSYLSDLLAKLVAVSSTP